MRAPSVKTLTADFKIGSDEAKLIRSIAAAADDGERLKTLVDAKVPGTSSYVRSMHSDPYRSRLWRTTVALHAMNEVMGTHGVEGLGPRRGGDYAPRYEYLNAGDTYAATLIYDRDGDRLFVGTWGDLVEKHPEWEGGGGDYATIKKTLPRGGKSPAQLDRDIAEVLGDDRKWRSRAAGWKV
jgi:hypothetical protein